MSKTFSVGGVHPHDAKFAKDCAIEELVPPKRVFISMSQHLGAPAKPIVAKGDHVLVGQQIAEAGGFISAPIHASVSGTVADVALYPDFMGKKVQTVVIDVEGDEWMEGIDRSKDIKREVLASPQDTLRIVKEMGIVGLGGAAFPTCVKLAPPPGSKAEFLILNGTECEPYLTSDYRLLMEHTEEVIIGGELMRRALGEPKGIIAIEDNKPLAIAKMRELTKHYLNWQVVSLKKRYPQGGEKQLIDAVTGRRVPSMGLPIATGAVVQNVGTAFAVYEAVQKNKPLISNILTVTGNAVNIQRNYRFRIGYPIRYILEMANACSPQEGLLPEVAKVVNGGPMMGKVVVDMEAPVVKSSSALLLLTQKETKRKPAGNCIRCGKCSQACPMALEPFFLYRLATAHRMEELDENHVCDCIECGCCLYTCPANIPLLDQIRLAKAAVMKTKKK